MQLKFLVLALGGCALVPKEPASHGFEEAGHPGTPTVPLGAFGRLLTVVTNTSKGI